MLTTGGKKNRNLPKLLKRLNIECGIEDLIRLIDFLEYAKKEFPLELAYWEENDMKGRTLPLDYRDWYEGWKEDECDFTVAIRANDVDKLKAYTFQDFEDSTQRITDEWKTILRSWEEEDNQTEQAEEDAKRTLDKNFNKESFFYKPWSGKMRAFGRDKSKNNDEWFDKATLVCNINEMDKIIEFFTHIQKSYLSGSSCTKEEMNNAISYGEWSSSWTDQESDLIMVLHNKEIKPNSSFL